MIPRPLACAALAAIAPTTARAGARAAERTVSDKDGKRVPPTEQADADVSTSGNA